MRLIDGAQIDNCAIHADDRGQLFVLEQSSMMPFLPERVFFMQVTGRDVVRGGHANSCDELIVPLSGAVTVDLDNGRERVSVRLHRQEQALLVCAGLLIHLREFEPNTLLLVCASARYEDTRHFSTPQPQMLLADA